MPYNFLVVDDERLSRSYIRNLLLDFEPESAIYEARSAVEARQTLDSVKIDVLFLDISMPEVSGMQLLADLPNRNFELIFVTAYSEYAIQAIKEGARDYLLKPIKIPEFKEALYKVLEHIKSERGRSPVTGMTEIEEALNQTLSIHTQRGTKFALIKHTVYIQADNTYTTIFLSGGEKIITTRPIIKFEEMLDTRLFYRIHKSYIINTYHFKEHISHNGDIALMDNGARLPVSRYRLKAFLEFLKNNPVK